MTDDRRRRRAAPAVLTLVIPLSLAAAAPAAAGLGEPPLLALVPIATGLVRPISVTHAGDERLFIILKDGRIVIHDGSQVLPEPFLDIRGLVRSNSLEQGLFSVAFHPGYPVVPYFYVDYTDLAGDTVVARYETDPADPDRALPDSALTVLAVDQPDPIHNGGQLQFGPDGYLYIGMGDGGPANDPQCQAQRGESLLGKLLRIDVDGGTAQQPYAIPPDNPFAGPGDPLDEIWALGLRNPWRFSFDRETGDLFLGDVGQASREEIDLQPAGAGGGRNYGWKRMEGNLCLDDTSACPPVPACGSPALTAPIFDYAHEEGRCAVIGGYVYRGTAIPELAGSYLYGDICTGELWVADLDGAAWRSRLLPINVSLLTSFGEDAAGELVLTSFDGGVYRLTGVPVPDAGAFELAQGAYETAEGAGALAVTVRRTGGDEGLVSVGFAAEPGTAAAGEDFEAVSGTLVWADGEVAEKSFTVKLIDDGAIEPDETFLVRLADPAGGAILGFPAAATVTILDDDLPPGPCVDSPTVLCLLGGRFRVEAVWEDHQGGSGPARAERFTDESGWFWFFNPLNTELVVKVRDACVPPFQRFWFFAAGLTDVGVTLTVADTEAREVRRYENPRGFPFQPVQDTNAFDTCP
jgi:glucose/arabinose dehydrogenase